MRYLFVFAHPDDESVACAGTIKSLTDAGDEVYLVTATLGDAGEVMQPAQKKLEKLGSLEELRKAELQSVCEHLGITQMISLGYKDGEIHNKAVWDELKQSICTQIELLKPDVVITFDHTGWYYHLDHVGVSIATTLAYNQSSHRPKVLLHSHFQPGGEKWQYVFHTSPATHKVLVADREHKLSALDLHLSQNLDIPKKYITDQKEHHELYELAFASDEGRSLMDQSSIFIQI